MSSPRIHLAAAVAPALAVAFLVFTDADGPQTGITHSLIRVGLWLGVLLSCATIAGRLLGSPLRGMAHLCWDGAAGLAAFMGIVLALGQIPGVFRPPVLAAGLAVLFGTAIFVAFMRRRGRRPANKTLADVSIDIATGKAPAMRLVGEPGAQHSSAGGTSTPWSPLVIIGLSLIAAAGLVWNRVPPVFFDTLVYHFAQPNLWLVNGVIAPEAWSMVSWFPPGMSVLYGVGLAFGGDAAANDANLLVGLLLMALVADLATRFWGRTAGLAAFACLAAMPMLMYALAVPAADLAHGLFTCGALAAILLWRERGEQSWLQRAAFFAAGAVLTKYTGLMVPLGLGALLLVLVKPPGPRPFITGLRRAALFLLPSLVLLAPWLVANSVTVGNPLAPVLAEQLPPRGLAEGGASAFRADAMGGLPGLTDLEHLQGKLLAGVPESAGIYPTPAWGWFALILLAGSLLALRHDAHIRILLGLSSIMFVLWFVTFRWERFLVATTALMCVAFGGFLARGLSRDWLPRFLSVAAALLAVLGLVRSGVTAARFTGSLPVALGQESPAALISRAFPFATVFADAGERLDSGRHRILLLGETRHHWLDVPHAAPSAFNVHPAVVALQTARSPAEADQMLRQAGFTHLLVDPAWVRRNALRYPSLARLADNPTRFEAYLKRLGRPLSTHGGVALYEIPAQLEAQDTGNQVPNTPM